MTEELLTKATSNYHPLERGTRRSFPGVKWPGHEADHPRPSSAEVKNSWNYTSIPPVRLHVVVLN